REECDIPVWHDDAQGTACVTLAGLINAVKLADKKLEDTKIVFLGAGAANATIARITIQAGADPENIVIFDSKGSLSSDRKDIEDDKRFYRKWELCQQTNPDKIETFSEAMTGADVLIALSRQGPDTVSPDDIKLMAPKSIVFVCANPIPEIYPYAAKEAGAFIVATGRGDFPNQVNNSVGFPGILKGALLVRARKISDGMAIAAAKSLARYAESRGITPDNIIATMDEPDVFPYEAADVAMQAIKEGLARVEMTRKEVFDKAMEDIVYSRKLVDSMNEEGYIEKVPLEMINKAFEDAVKSIEE
ncbi:MAG TPA: malate dehydrogenase, partial [Spirochaeta sp.]|nr:malate dehydrogenase [Spirochaeta sp.]